MALIKSANHDSMQRCIQAPTVRLTKPIDCAPVSTKPWCALRHDETVPCGADVAALGDFAVQRLGVVHRWINNAGQVTRKRVLADLDAAEIADVVGANVLGSLLCCRCGLRLSTSFLDPPPPCVPLPTIRSMSMVWSKDCVSIGVAASRVLSNHRLCSAAVQRGSAGS